MLTRSDSWEVMVDSLPRKPKRRADGGEGSKGGHVIGHTNTGKPIYASPFHPSHASFTQGEHHEAAALHHKARERAKSAPMWSPERAEAERHEAAIDHHKRAARAKAA